MIKMQLKYIKSFFTLLFLGIVFNSNAQTGIVDKIVAQIGEEIIMLSDIQKTKLQLIQEGVDPTKKMDCDILEELLFQKLLLNQAKIDSVEVNDESVNANMEQRLRYFEAQIGGREELEKFYGKSIAQIKAEFFKVIKEGMLAEQMKNKITENLVVTPKDINQFFNDLDKDSVPYINSKISVAHIVIYPEITETDKLKAKQELEGYREQIINNERSFKSFLR